MPQSTSLIPHAFSEILPAMADSDLASLRESLKTDGYIGPPIYTFEGKILDGVHRYRLCMELGIDPQFVEYAGADAFRFALNQNLARRHLNESQRAMVAARLVTTQPHRPSKLSRSIDLLTQPSAASLLTVSTPSVKRAKALLATIRHRRDCGGGRGRPPGVEGPPHDQSGVGGERTQTAFGIHRQRYQRMPHGRSS